MPFIVTTKRPVDAVDAGHPEAPKDGWPVSRRAAATLDEAREACIEASPEEMLPRVVVKLAQQIAAVSESGGTVGPLPDGSVIEVERRTWEELAHDEAAEAWADELTGDPATPDAVAHTAIIAAYNAAQKAVA